MNKYYQDHIKTDKMGRKNSTPKLKNFHRRLMDQDVKYKELMGEIYTEKADRKEKLYVAIEAWVIKERKTNPNFFLTYKNLGTWARNNKDVTGIVSASGL